MLVVVKGSKAEALRALCARGITEILGLEEHEKFPEAFVRIPDRYWWDVQRWFCEPSGRAPFPAGTCLFYAHTKVGAEP